MREILFVIFVIVTRTVSQICDYTNSVELTNRSYNGVQYGDGEYFVDNVTGVERGCVCKKGTCVRKCCPIGQGYNPKIKKCIDVSETFDPPVYEGSTVKQSFHALTEFHLLFYKMNCSTANNEYRMILSSLSDAFYLKTDGKLYIKDLTDQPTKEYGADKYCIDNFVTENENDTSVKLDVLVCLVTTEERNHFGVSASCMLISCFFIILTVAVYFFLPRLRTLNGMVMITYLLNLFVSFLFMATMQILLMVGTITEVYCVSLTFVIYFTILAAFFWLNVMCYDLWSKLRSSQNMAHGFATSARLRYLSYCGYAFGLPTVLTILLAALEFSNLPHNIRLLPHLRRDGCFLYGTSRLIYLYTPILFAIVANLIFFILTAKILVRMKKQAECVRKNKNTQRYSLYIKLFIITGINWVLEVISSLYPEADNFWQYTDAYNVLVGLIIFIIFVCKKKTLMSIHKRYRVLMGKPLTQIRSSVILSNQTQVSIQSQSE